MVLKSDTVAVRVNGELFRANHKRYCKVCLHVVICYELHPVFLPKTVADEVCVVFLRFDWLVCTDAFG